MICPIYEGDRKCGYKSKHYILSEAHVEECCEGDPYKCQTFRDNKKRTISINKFIETVGEDSKDMYSPEPVALRQPKSTRTIGVRCPHH